MTKMMTQDRVSLELRRQVGCHLGHSFYIPSSKSPPLLALWPQDSWLLRSGGSSRSQGLETGLGSEEDIEDVKGPGCSAGDLGCNKAELNPTLKSPFPVQPAPFVENGHQPLPLALASGNPRTPTWAPQASWCHQHGRRSPGGPRP